MTDVTYVGAGTEAVSASAGANVSVPYPAGLAAGDYLGIFCDTTVSTAFASGAVSGFTRLYTSTANGSSPSGAHYYKIATGSETGSITLTNPGGIAAARMFAWRNVDTTTPFDDTAAVGPGSSTSVTAYAITAQTVASAGAVSITHVWSNATTGSFTPPASHTELWDSNAGGTGNVQEVAHRLSMATGSTGTRTATRSVALRGGWAGLLLKPITAVQVAAAGEADAVSDGAGAATTVQPAAGSAAGVSATTGAGAYQTPASGRADATSSGAGSVGQRLVAAATIAALSVVVGSGAAVLAGAGTAAATSSSTGAAGVITASVTQAAAGQADAVSGTSGAAGAIAAAAGRGDAVSGSSGAAGIARAAAGTTAAASGGTGAAAARLTGAGAAAGVTGSTGATLVTWVAAGAADAQVDVAGSAAALLEAAGQADAVSDSSGAGDVLHPEVPVSLRLSSRLHADTVEGDLHAHDVSGWLRAETTQGVTE